MTLTLQSSTLLTARMAELSQARVDKTVPTQLASTAVNVADPGLAGLDPTAYSELLLRDTVSKSFELTARVQIKSQDLEVVARYLTDIQTRIDAQTGLPPDGADYQTLESEILSLEDQLSQFVGTQATSISELNASYSEFNDFQAQYFSTQATNQPATANSSAQIEINLTELVNALQNSRVTADDAHDHSVSAAPSVNNTNVTGSTTSSNSNVSYIEPLRMGAIWDLSADETLSYSYYDTQSPPYVGYPAGGVNPPIAASSLIAFAREIDQAFALWDQGTDGITFERVTEAANGTVGELRLAYTDNTQTPAGSAAYAYGPGNGTVNGDIWFDQTQVSNQSFTVGEYGFMTALHEIGHALGLSHPFDASSDTGVNLSAADDNLRNTLMSYTNIDRNLVLSVTSNGNGGWTANLNQGVYSATPMIYDIATLEFLYGASTTAHTGDTVYQWDQNPVTLETIVDSGGVDTIDASNQTRSSVIDLTPGHFSSIGYWSQADQLAYYQSQFGGNTSVQLQSYLANSNAAHGVSDVLYTGEDNVGIAFSANIENAKGGSGNDTLIGNDLDNVLTGNGGNDTITGGLGNDTVVMQGVFLNYELNQQGGGWTITDRVGSEGIDVLNGVEFVEFSDVVWDLQLGVVSKVKFVPNWSEKQGYVFAHGYMTQRLSEMATNKLDDGSRQAFTSSQKNDRFIGSAQSDVVNYQAANSGVMVDLAAGIAQSIEPKGKSSIGQDELIQIDDVVGSQFADFIMGNDADNVIDGHGGADVIDGGQGMDTAIFSGHRYDYSIEKVADGYVISKDGVSTVLRNVERVQFDSGVYQLVDPKTLASANTFKTDLTTTVAVEPVNTASQSAVSQRYTAALQQITTHQAAMSQITNDLVAQANRVLDTRSQLVNGLAVFGDNYFDQTASMAKNAIVQNTINAIVTQANTTKKDVLNLLK
jgi:hypothetical protein